MSQLANGLPVFGGVKAPVVHYARRPLAAITLAPNLVALVEAPAKAAIQRMVKSIMREIVEPALAARTRAAFVAVVLDKLWTFDERFDALIQFCLTVVKPEIFIAAHNERESAGDSSIELDGEDTAVEVDFCVTTFKNATSVVSRIIKDETVLSEAALKEDAERATFYNFGSALYYFASMLLAVCKRRQKGPAGKRVPKHIVRAVLEMLREGALTAYVAAEQGLDLRLPPESDSEEKEEPIAFDTATLDFIDTD